MRSEPTEAEARCWALLPDRRLAEFKFRRQLPFGNYIIDFVCLGARLIIELDGSQHAGSMGDEARDAYLVKQGYKVLRVWNNEILRNSDVVLDTICRFAILDGSAGARPTPHPSRPAADPPSPSRGEGKSGIQAAQQ
jgi:very-short-patch-repair endonuclease